MRAWISRQFKRLTVRLVVSHVAVALVVLVVAVLISGWSFRDYLIRSQTRALHVRGEQIARVMTGYFLGTLSKPAAAYLINTLQGTLDDRLYVIDQTGTLLIQAGRSELPVVPVPPAVLREVLTVGQPWSGVLTGSHATIVAAAVPVVIGGNIMGGILLEQPLGGITRTATSLVSLLFWGELVAVLFAGLLAYSLSRRLSRPLEELRRSVEGMEAERPAIAVRIEGPAEVEELAQEFHRMGARIADQMIRLEEEKRARDALLAHVAHDLRTPLTSIRGFLEAVRDGVMTGPAMDRAIAIAWEETLRLQRLVNRLLQATRIQSGMAEKERLSLNQWIGDTLQRIEPLTREKGVAVAWQPQGDVELWGVRDHLIEALVNVLDNAIKWSPEGERIELATYRQDHPPAVVVQVRDHGPGIAPEVLPHVLERFVTGDQARSDSSGLGLSIVADVMKEHQGQVEVHNHPGGGTEVRLTLPLPAESTGRDGQGSPFPVKPKARYNSPTRNADQAAREDGNRI
ncbi:MAG: HAMP domain-containing histidine kinase [Firmicutes bacterium]|nr:HAMP domain-containing histidine kinase [Alicyclobacillaceae bacterium]MCL6497683.1 HAMP domain-containing histidine kinase [Bacillota bacterium]